MNEKHKFILGVVAVAAAGFVIANAVDRTATGANQAISQAGQGVGDGSKLFLDKAGTAVEIVGGGVAAGVTIWAIAEYALPLLLL